MTKAVSNREICFIKAVLLLCEHGHYDKINPGGQLELLPPPPPIRQNGDKSRKLYAVPNKQIKPNIRSPGLTTLDWMTFKSVGFTLSLNNLPL